MRREIKFSNICQKSEKKSCHNKKVHNSNKSLPIDLKFFSNIPILLVQQDSTIKKVVSLTKLIRSIFKKSISTFLRGPEEANPRKNLKNNCS